MDRLLDDQTARQIGEAFAQLKEGVQILFFGDRQGCDYCAEAQQLLEEVAALHEKVSISLHDIRAEGELAARYHVDKAPTLVFAARDGAQISDLGIRFSGLPSGHEFATLINDVIIVSGRESGLSPAAREYLKGLRQPLLLQVFVTPT